MKIKELDNKQLARELLRILWRTYDDQGVSIGRSFRAGYLEQALDLIPMVKIIDDDFDDKFHLNEFLKEANLRLKKKIPAQGMLFTELPFISDEALAGKLLEKIADYYDEDAKRPDHLSIIERQILDAARSLIPLPYNCPDYKKEELYFESKDRRYERVLRQFNLPDLFEG